MNMLNTFINRNGEKEKAAKQNKLEQKLEKKANKLTRFLNKISKRPQPAAISDNQAAASIETLTPPPLPTTIRTNIELFKKRVTFSTDSSFNPKLNKLSNESISLYQMYNDNNTFTEFNMSDNPTESSFDSSDNGFESDFTSSKLSIDQAKPALKSILSNRSSNSSVSGDSLLAHSFSTLKLDQQIRFKLAGLKLTSARLGLFQSNVCMLEAVYGLKIDAVRVEARAVLSKFDRKTIEHAEKKSLNKFISTTAKLFKSYRRRSKSVELNKEVSVEKSFAKQQHSNYYACERDALEKKFEDQMRAIQVGVLEAIGGVEQQLHEIMLRKEVSLSSQSQKKHCHHHHHKRCQKHRHDLNKSRANYSTELPMQKRINRQKERSTNLNGYVLRDRSYDASRLSGSFNQSLNSSDLQAKKYRNPYATETSV